MRGRLAATLLIALAASVPAAGHVGSPDTFFEGHAGPYPVRVIVRSPGVVPGLAEVNVRVKEGTANRVSVRPVEWRAGVEGAPPADEALAVRGDEGLFSVEIWFMTLSSYSVYVEVEGPAGSGTAVVPVMPSATRRLEMQKGLGVLLALLAALLFAGAVTLVGAAVREGVVAPGEEPTKARRMGAQIAMGVSAIVLAFVVYGGKLWWDGEDRQHEERMFRSFAVSTEVMTDGATRTLELKIDDEDWLARRWTPLVPDHGKLMHMFLIRDPGLDGFAHIHPVRLDEDRFAVDIPPLPDGTYAMYADVTHGSGFTQTLTDQIELPALVHEAALRTDELAPDPDDSWLVAAVDRPSVFIFDDGNRLLWERTGAVIVGRDVDLRFSLRTEDGDPVPLEPYMGMASHAAVRHHDGSVFVHLHPVGTISMVSQAMFVNQQFAAREPESEAAVVPDPPPPMQAAGHQLAGLQAGSVALPYSFPRSGLYRIWVQVKSSGRVYTGVFDVEVLEEADQPS